MCACAPRPARGDSVRAPRMVEPPLQEGLRQAHVRMAHAPRVGPRMLAHAGLLRADEPPSHGPNMRCDRRPHGGLPLPSPRPGLSNRRFVPGLSVIPRPHARLHLGLGCPLPRRAPLPSRLSGHSPRRRRRLCPPPEGGDVQRPRGAPEGAQAQGLSAGRPPLARALHYGPRG